MAKASYIPSRAWRQTQSTISCERCGSSVIQTGARQRFCSECAEMSRLASKRRSNSNRRREDGCEPIGSIVECRVCGIKYAKTAPVQPYCGKECRLKSRRTGHAIIQCKICDREFQRTASAQVFCAPCGEIRAKETKKVIRERNQESIRLSRERWAARNPEKIAAGRKRLKSSPAYRARANERQREQRRDCPSYAINARIRSAIGMCLRGKKAGRKWQDLVGYSSDDLMKHIERQFLPGMTWENRDKWHLDHIVPLSSFAFESAECEGFKACWALTNLRPIWKTQNLQKWARRTHLI